MNRRRIVSLLLCALFLAVILLSCAFVVSHAQHVCTGVNCAVCLELRSCAGLISGVLARFGAAFFAVLSVAAALFAEGFRAAVKPSPVSLCVKLTI